MAAGVLSVSEAALFLNVNPKTVRTWIGVGKLNASRVGRLYFISRLEVEKMASVKQTDVADAKKAQCLASLRGCTRGSAVDPKIGQEERRQRNEASIDRERRFAKCT